jgi:antitoxin FitA
MTDSLATDRTAPSGSSADVHVLAPKWRYTQSMPSIQIKNVPPEVHRVLRQRAAAAGQSMQEYLLAQLTRVAETETLEEVLDRIGSRSGSTVTLDFAVESIRKEREERS